MCGLVGFLGIPFSLTPEIIIKGISHRGPDSSGVYFNRENRLMLAHSRLSILDLTDSGNQPMSSDNARFTLIFNGEIYNYNELKNALTAAGQYFKGNSDTEVLLKLLELADGDEYKIRRALRRLNGIFAFALWDNVKQKLLVARDNFGVKPLYYFANKSFYCFSSEIKVLVPVLQKLGYCSQLNYAALDRYLTFLWCPGDETLLSDIQKLGPGQAMFISKDSGCYSFDWRDNFEDTFPGYLSDQRLIIDKTAGLLEDAVHRQMVSDVPLGAFLSGGLDSSAIVAFAVKKNPDLRCFSILQSGGVDSGANDDLPYAKRVAKYLGVHLDVVDIDSYRIASDLEKMIFHLDEPLADPAPLNVLYISQIARQNGIKVLLSGAGGDDLFSGYRRHTALAMERYWSWLPLFGRKGLEKITSSFDQRNSLGRRLAKIFNGASLSSEQRLVNYFYWNRRENLVPLYSTDLHLRIREGDAPLPMLNYLSGLPDYLNSLERLLALEQRFFLTDHNLLYTDKMSMAVGVEVRVPFLDNELVNFSKRIPSKWKQNGYEGKWILKKAMTPFLPKDVIYRSKTGFGAPIRKWIRHDLREMVGDYLSESTISGRGLFNPKAVHELIKHNDSGRVDGAYTIFALLCIEIWCRKFLDTPS
jgi:asparagine synthase (glutamine-hydrolysing)